MHCSYCELAWLYPSPIAEDVAKLYTEYFTHRSGEPSQKGLANLRKAVKAQILRKCFGYPLDTQGGLLTQVLAGIGPLKEIVAGSLMYLDVGKKGRLLDVGCGNGRFLAQMRELGWEVMGVEPDPEAVRIAREQFGLEIFQGTLEEARFPDDNFDAITLNHVIEHVTDPISLLTECRRILKPVGKLVVVTPNIRSLGARLFGKAWLHWDPPRHLFLFSPKSLRICAEQAGLKVQSIRTSSKGARFMWAASRLIQERGKLPGGSPRRLGWGLKLESLVFWAVEYLACRLQPNVGEEVVLEATK